MHHALESSAISREDLIVLLGREALYPTPLDDPDSLGRGVDGLLLELLQDVSLSADTAPGNGWVPIHAATLLGRRQVVDAIPLLLQRLQHGNPDDASYSAAVQALCLMGPGAMAPTLAQWADSPAPFSDYAYILAHCEAQDDRILARLLAGLSRPGEAAYYANLLAHYGDDRALNSLAIQFDWTSDHAMAPEVRLHTLRELREAIEVLFGELRIDQALRLAGLEGDLARAHAETTAPPKATQPEASQRGPSKRGRNDPCWCGSGKKYKKCHAQTSATQASQAE